MRLQVVISDQVIIFLQSVFGGAIIAFIYDIFRLKRKVVKTKGFALNIEDFAYWVIVSFVMFAVVFYSNEGELRGFIILGAIIGVVLYILLLSSLIMNILTTIVNFIIKVIIRVWKIIILPIRIIVKVLLVPIKLLLKGQSKTIKGSLTNISGQLKKRSSSKSLKSVSRHIPKIVVQKAKNEIEE